MRSLILQFSVRLFFPVMVLVSLVVLLRGHNDPGGGFVGGLILAAALALHAVAFSPHDTRRLMRLEPQVIIGLGLALAAISGLFSYLQGEPYLTSQWIELHPPGGSELHLGTPVIFDIGVYLTVAGSVTLMVLPLMEE